MLEALTGVPFQTALSDAFGKFERDLPEQMREYLNKLPSVVNALPVPGKPRSHPGKDRFAERLVNASLERRQVRMRYFSLSHEREGDYIVWPVRIIYMQGALYLRAWVPAYGEVRTFATHRIKELSILEDRFTPSPEWAEEPFSNSLGPNDGKAIHVVLRFEPALANARPRADLSSVPAHEAAARRLTALRDRRLRRRLAPEFHPPVRAPRPGGRAARPRRPRSSKSWSWPRGTTPPTRRSIRWPPRPPCSS